MASIVSSLQLQTEIAQLPLDDMAAMVRRQTWLVSGRPDQMTPSEVWEQSDVGEGRRKCPPEMVGSVREDWFLWLMMAGRGSGKTRAGAEDFWWYGYRHPGARMAIVAPTSNDTRKTCFEGESGLLACIPPELILNWNRGEMVLTLKNGSMYQGYSADEPDRLRGPQHHRAWCDELAAWRYLDDTLDNLLMGLRLGDNPRIVATTTPRPILRLKEIVADPTTWVDTVSTYANIRNLPKIFVEKILKRYEGTRLGRQELSAEILTDNPSALWQRSTIDELRILERPANWRTVTLADGREVSFQRVVVGVDPSSGGTGEDGATTDAGDETGIVVVAIGDDGVGYVLADCSLMGTPAEWGRAAVVACDDFGADMIVYEANQGGEMVRQTLTSVARAMREAGERRDDFVPTRAVWASRGKVTRAEPVSTLYETRRVRHVGTHSTLEDQMCEFTTNFDRKRMGYSPDRVDALVWAVTHLMLSDDAGLNVQDYYRQEQSRHAEALAQRTGGLVITAKGEMAELLPPPNVSMAFGIAGHRYVLNERGVMVVHLADVETLVRSGFRPAPPP